MGAVGVLGFHEGERNEPVARVKRGRFARTGGRGAGPI
jgi:hypothetical protein